MITLHVDRAGGSDVPKLATCRWFCAGFLGLLAAGGGCEREQIPVTVQVTLQPDYLEIYGLAERQDETHTIRMVSPDGQTWYREPRPIIDLSMIDLAETGVQRYHTGGYAVLIIVSPPFNQRLGEWSQSRIGSHAGVVVQGKLVRIDEILTTMYTTRLLIPFSSQEAAADVAATVRNGGLPGRK